MDKELLFKPRTPESEVEIPGVGIMRVRGLTRAEAHDISAIKSDAGKERRILACGVIDPTLTEQDVIKWQEASTAGEIQAVAQAITKLSGMDEAAAKAAYATFPGESRD